MLWSNILLFLCFYDKIILGDYMKIVKKLIKALFFIFLIVILVNYKEVSNYIVSNFIYNKNTTIEISKGEYSKETSYGFVQITDDLVAKDYQHLLNIIYTILDSGNDTFSFYCSDDYKDCLTDIDNLISGNQDSILSDINNFVHPYYTYKNIAISTNNYGKVTIELEKQYSKEEISYINEQLSIIEEKIIKDDYNNKDKILAMHDYIVNNTKYDMDRAENMNSPKFTNSKTHTAYGLLTEKKTLCGGYSDLMSIYIHRLGINNFRITGSNHIWNLVNIDGWKHLDATWDDPVTNTGEDILIHDYFLITTKELKKADEVEHQFNKDIYIEAN